MEESRQIVILKRSLAKTTRGLCPIHVPSAFENGCFGIHIVGEGLLPFVTEELLEVAAQAVPRVRKLADQRIDFVVPSGVVVEVDFRDQIEHLVGRSVKVAVFYRE